MTATTTGPAADGDRDEEDTQRKRRSNIPSLVCAFMASLTTGGTTYAFGLYGSALKRTLHLSQPQLDTISTSFFFAGLFSWIPGSIADRMGTRFALSTGGMTGAGSLMAYWCVARQFVPMTAAVAVPVLSVLGILIFLSSALVTGSVFKIIMGTCGPGTKGSAVGVAKGYVGLGSGAYACLFEAIRRPSTSDLDFLPMAAFFALACATTPALLLLPPKAQCADGFLDQATPLHFRTIMSSLVVMASLIVGTSLLALRGYSDEDDDNNNNNNNDFGGGPGGDFLDGEDDIDIEDVVFGGDLIPASSSSEGPNYVVAVMIVSIWLGPIIASYFFPRGSDAQMHELVQDLSDENDESGNDEQEAMVVHHRHHSTEDAATRTTAAATATTTSAVRRSRSHSPTGRLSAATPCGEEGTGGDLSMIKRDGKLSKDDGSGAKGNNRNRGRGRGGGSSETSEGEHLLRAGGGDDRIDDDVDNGDLAPSAAANRENGQDNSVSGENGAPVTASSSSASSSVHRRPGLGEDLTLVQMLRTPSALLMLWTTTILVGAGTLETNNMGQMVESLGFRKSVTPASLALFSVAQAAGRVLTGAISESALNWSTRSCLIDNGVPRPFFLIVAAVVAMVSHFVLSLAAEEISFVGGSALSGFAFGMVWPLMVLIVGEVFGTAHVGANYMFYDGCTSAVGTLLLSKLLAQQVYEENIRPHADDPYTCYGTACFGMTHMWVAVLALSCVLTSGAMMYTSRHVYNSSSLHRT